MSCPRHPVQSALFLALLGLASLTPVGAQVAPPEPVAAAEAADTARHAALQSALETALRAEFEAQGLVGLAAAVVRDGKVAHELYLGHADRAANVHVDAHTLFRWASISKPVTAVAAMQLVLAEKLDLDRDVRTYVPEFPEKPWPLTARQLLCHQGGVVHYTNGKVVRTDAQYDREHPFEDVVLALDQFKASDLVAEPGTTYAYTTHGYMLLGAVVERAGGERFADQVRRRVAEPAGMTSFQPDYQWVDIPHRAVGYRRLGEAILPTTNTDVSWKLPGGGFISNVGDLARFAAALMGDTLLPADTRERMWTNQSTRDGKRTGYGLGFGVSNVDGERRIAHSGSQEKTRTLMQLFPKDRVAVVLMTNSEWAKLDTFAAALWAHLR
jgi:serine beta-lactamase-like protein LACTB